jgi:putative flippase GtrA
MKWYLRRYLHSHSRLAQFLRFATVGVKVSLIDAGGTYLLPWLFGMNLHVARVISLTTAIMVGYLLNRYFTFGRDQRGSFHRQMAGHFGVHAAGGLLNYAVFSGVIALGYNHLIQPQALLLLPLVAIWIGGLVGLVFNFSVSSKLVFSHRAETAPMPP